MIVSIDGKELGVASNLEELTILVGDRHEEIVWASHDGEEVAIDTVLGSAYRFGNKLEFCTFGGWLDRSAKILNELSLSAPSLAKSILIIDDNLNLMESIDAQLNPVSKILGDLKEVEAHLGPDVVKNLRLVEEVVQGGRYAVETALRRKDFVDLADVLRSEWSLAIRLFIGFLDPESNVENIAYEPPLVTHPSDDIFKANCDALQERFPAYVQDVISAWETRDENRYEVIETSTGHRVPRVNGFYQWSRVQPRADSRWISEMNRADRKEDGWDLALSWGIPSPLAVELLSEERPDRPVILPRHDLAAFACELHCVDCTDLLVRQNVILTATLLEFRWAMRKLLIMDDRVRRLSSPTMFQLDPVLGAELHEESFNTHLARSMESFTGYNRSREWTEKALDNALRLLSEPDVHLFRDRFKGMPGIMVAPGPSLKKNIHLIPKFAEKGVVCCVSHVLRRLNDMGVDPDLTVAIEANSLAPHFENTRVDETSIMLSENSAANTVSQPARQFWVMNDGTVGNWLREEEVQSPNMVASSCTQVALWCLKELGCNPIVLVGLDLALEDGKQYTDGCAGWTSTQGNLEVDGYYGDKVETIATYNTFRDQFNLIFQQPDFQEIRCINSTEGGARLEGIEHIGLQEVLDQLEDIPPRVEAARGLVAREGELNPVDWSQVIEKLEYGIEQIDKAGVSAFEAGRSAKSAADALRAGNTRKMASKSRTAARIAKTANEVLKEDKVFEVGWLGPQHALSMRREREATYLEDGSEAKMRHNLSHYLQFLASIHYGAKELRELYVRLLERVREQTNV
ncbi:MAG: hypothetical protein CMH50_09475 [Myxococcales bacterium]|nr:hypothetical protein [Myxococcales bacterium]|tara:strand:- start:150 stop:2555 length:2406 start_codon:yes stop_codon:yes gene_type:complete